MRRLVATLLVGPIALAALTGIALPASAKTKNLTSLSAAQILKTAINTEDFAGTVHIRGRITTGRTYIAFNLEVVGHDNGAGTFSVTGDNIRVAKVDTEFYFNATASFWKKNGGTAAATAYGGKWVEVPASTAEFASFTQFMNPGSFATSLFNGVKRLQKGLVVSVAGAKAIPVFGATVKNGKLSAETMYIATTGMPYVLEILAKGPKENGQINFSGYGAPITVAPPASAINLGATTTTTKAR